MSTNQSSYLKSSPDSGTFVDSDTSPVYPQLKTVHESARILLIMTRRPPSITQGMDTTLDLWPHRWVPLH